MQDPTQDTPRTPPPGTPPRPPYSPVTPVFAQLAPLASNEPKIIPPPLSPSPTSLPQTTYSHAPPANPPVYKPEPPPVPISESENPDAIALRSAISILQMQKQQSLRDIQTLDRMKGAAEANPEAFAHELATGRLKTEDRGAVVQFSDDSMETEDADGNPKRTNPDGSPASSFGSIPAPQNVVRMPPINWAKYSVVGEPLDRMHAEQLRRPYPGEPRQTRAPEHLLASPYRPLVDQLDAPTRPSRSSKPKKT